MVIEPVDAQGPRALRHQILPEAFMDEGVFGDVDRQPRADHRLAPAIARRIVVIDAEIAAHTVAEVIMRAEIEVVAFDVGDDRDRIVEAETGDPAIFEKDRKSVVQGKSVSVRVDLGGRRIIKKKKQKKQEK